MQTIEIKALDTLFFRDGKPFDMGDDNWAEGMFPPSPGVIYGALRTAWFAENPDKIHLLNTENDPTKELKITEVYLKKGNNLYLSIPHDLVCKKDAEDRLFRLNLIDSKSASHNYNLPYIPFFKGHAESAGSAFLSLSDFDSYYSTEFDESGLSFCKTESFFTKEPKIGVGIDNNTRASDEGKLFRLGMFRLKPDVSLLIEYNLDFMPKTLRLGADNKIVNIEKSSYKRFVEPNETKSKYAKIILKTPAISNENWLEFVKTKMPYCKIIAAFIGKAINIGGWDIQNKQPKPLYKAIPQGSVVYIECNREYTTKTLTKTFLQIHSFSELRSEEGFGLYETVLFDFNSIYSNSTW
jgi:CRISPR-associated protein Cmr3